MTGPCFFCGRTGVWCSRCKAYLCDEHRKNYPLRAAHVITHPADTTKKLLNYLTGR